MPLTKTLNGVEISYDQSDYAEGSPIVLLSGWAHDLSLYDNMTRLLAPKYRVIRFSWRGHSSCRDGIEPFGVEEQVSDALALLQALEVVEFHLVAHSHGAWPALELVDQLGKARILSPLIVDEIMSPPPLAFAAGLKGMQDKETWLAARKGLFENWLGGSKNKAVNDHLMYCMSSYGHDMWSLSCQVIEKAYKEHGSPVERMKMFNDPPPIRHAFSHPVDSEAYRKLHEEMAAENPWFTYTDLKGETHFPSLEMPEKVWSI
jgi:pimeloyl-ACP methyl ester carboxylesterase